MIDFSLLLDVLIQGLQGITILIGSATLLLQVIPQLDKKNKFKPVLQAIGRYVALNKPLLESLRKK